MRHVLLVALVSLLPKSTQRTPPTGRTRNSFTVFIVMLFLAIATSRRLCINIARPFLRKSTTTAGKQAACTADFPCGHRVRSPTLFFAKYLKPSLKAILTTSLLAMSLLLRTVQKAGSMALNCSAATLLLFVDFFHQQQTNAPTNTVEHLQTAHAYFSTFPLRYVKQLATTSL